MTNEWKCIWSEKPPYFEIVQFKLIEGKEDVYCSVPFTHGAVIPGTVFDEYHEDFIVDDSLDTETLAGKDVVAWRSIDFEGMRPRVKFIDLIGRYDFEFTWSPQNAKIK